MYLTRLLSLCTTGTMLIASQCPWFLNSSTKPKAMEIGLANALTAVEEPPKDVNRFPEEESEISNSTPIISANYKNKSHNNTTYVTLTTNGETSKTLYLYKPSTVLSVFSLTFPATKESYSEVKKEEIKIRLFVSPAWESENYEDKYGDEMGAEAIFSDGIDEFKAKQLLLSLSTRRDWELSSKESTSGFWSGHDYVRPKSVDDLKNLKIKHFKDFNLLKKYVHDKVKTCVNPERACVAKVSELSVMEEEFLNFYESTN